MDEIDEATAMRRLLTLALLGERYLEALDELGKSKDSMKEKGPAGWTVWKGRGAEGNGLGADAPSPGSSGDVPEVDGLPLPALSATIAPEDLQLFFDEGFAERVPGDPTSIRLTPEGLMRAMTLSEFFYDALDKGFDDFLDERFGASAGPVRAFRFRVELKGCDCWREVVVPAFIDFATFGDVIQRCFNWTGYHLWDFEFRSHGEKLRLISQAEDRSDFYPVDFPGFGMPSGRRKSEPVVDYGYQVYLDEVFPRTRTATYLYDYGDGWEHSIRLIETIDDYEGPYPLCADGAGDAPPEDVGGPGGFARFKQLLVGPDCPERRETLEWADDQGFEHFDLQSVNSRLFRR